jgi:hypothetical protein
VFSNFPQTLPSNSPSPSLFVVCTSPIHVVPTSPSPYSRTSLRPYAHTSLLFSLIGKLLTASAFDFQTLNLTIGSKLQRGGSGIAPNDYALGEWTMLGL